MCYRVFTFFLDISANINYLPTIASFIGRDGTYTCDFIYTCIDICLTTWLCVTYHDFFKVLALQVMKGLQEVLLHAVVQGVLDVGNLLHGIPRLDQRLSCNGRAA